MPPSDKTSVSVLTKLDVLIERVNAIDKRTCILENISGLMATVNDHETILRGPDRQDGLITQMIRLNDRITQQENRINTMAAETTARYKSLMNWIKALVVPLVLALIVFLAGIYWGLLTHQIMMTFGH
jgi:hypothetical protein